jgi:hypothetical protein
MYKIASLLTALFFCISLTAQVNYSSLSSEYDQASNTVKIGIIGNFTGLNTVTVFRCSASTKEYVEIGEYPIGYQTDTDQFFLHVFDDTDPIPGDNLYALAFSDSNDKMELKHYTSSIYQYVPNTLILSKDITKDGSFMIGNHNQNKVEYYMIVDSSGDVVNVIDGTSYEGRTIEIQLINPGKYMVIRVDFSGKISNCTIFCTMEALDKKDLRKLNKNSINRI